MISMKTFRRAAFGATLGVLQALPAQADDINVDINGCVNLGGIFTLCGSTNNGGNHYPRGGYNHDVRKVEIGRVPAGYRCPRGTDTEAVIGNQFPGTNRATKICYDHRRP